MRLVAGLLFALSCLSVSAQVFEFTGLPSASGINGAMEVRLDTDGTLIGNYDTASNPTGTRTKPGLFGSFLDTENVAVPVEVFGTVGSRSAGSISTQSSGNFTLEIDPAMGKAYVTRFSLDFLNGSSLSIPSNISLRQNGFRTRSPSFFYLGGTIGLPIGNVTLGSLRGTQMEPSPLGTCNTLSATQYSVAVPIPLVLSGSMLVMGSEIPLPPIPFEILLMGVVTVDGASATVASQSSFTLEETRQPNQPIPPFDLALPTTGDPANVIMSLILTEQTTYFQGTNTMACSGPVLASGRVDATVTFQDLAPGIYGPQDATMDIYDVATGDLAYRRGLLPAAGLHAIRLPHGTYDLALKESHWLRRRVRVTVGTTPVAATLSLLNGDVNGDNSVNIADYLIVRGAFGTSSDSPNYVAAADLDGNGSVNATDFLILRKNFGRAGD